MASIDQLLTAIKYLDNEGHLQGLTYEKTYNESLGLPDQSPDFHVFMPYGNWPPDVNTKVEVPSTSVLEDAFVKVLETGAPETDTKSCFIDIIHLQGNVGNFFHERTTNGKTIAETIVDIVNRTDGDPVIRFLIGAPGIANQDKLWNDEANIYTDIFWDKGQSGQKGKPRIEKDKAQKTKLHVGYYSPNFKPEGSQSVKPAVRFMDTMLNLIRIVPFKSEGLKQALEMLPPETFVQSIMTSRAPSISWNHGKIVAVNGKVLMTGGANYWVENMNGGHGIFEMQAKIKGDATISAHSYADYFWKYLNRNDRITDTQSFRKTVALTGDRPESSEWKFDPKDPKSKAPLFDRKPAATSGIPVLTVARLGDWTGPMKSIEYPIQTVDALRDLFFNYLWELESNQKSPDFKGIVTLASWLVDGGKLITTILKVGGITPAAWASRYARTQAISNAKRSVHISAAMIVAFLQLRENSWKDIVMKTVNEKLRLGGVGKYEWDGFLWPFDLMMAFGTCLWNMRKDPSEKVGVFIVLSKMEPGGFGDWADATSALRMKRRLKIIMKGMIPELISMPPGDVDKLVDTKFHIRRVLDNKSAAMHNKVICVDGKLLYVGSDNLYPSYNEEHGVWVEDKKTVDSWLEDYFDQLWKRSHDAKDDEAVKDKGFETDAFTK